MLESCINTASAILSQIALPSSIPIHKKGDGEATFPQIYSKKKCLNPENQHWVLSEGWRAVSGRRCSTENSASATRGQVNIVD